MFSFLLYKFLGCWYSWFFFVISVLWDLKDLYLTLNKFLKPFSFLSRRRSINKMLTSRKGLVAQSLSLSPFLLQPLCLDYLLLGFSFVLTVFYLWLLNNDSLFFPVKPKLLFCSACFISLLSYLFFLIFIISNILNFKLDIFTFTSFYFLYGYDFLIFDTWSVCQNKFLFFIFF